MLTRAALLVIYFWVSPDGWKGDPTPIICAMIHTTQEDKLPMMFGSLNTAAKCANRHNEKVTVIIQVTPGVY